MRCEKSPKVEIANHQKVYFGSQKLNVVQIELTARDLTARDIKNHYSLILRKRESLLRTVVLSRF